MYAMRTLVTGATGFIGRHLFRTLKNSGHICCAATRRPGVKIESANEYVCLDLYSPDAFKRVPTDFDAIVHLADGFSKRCKNGLMKTRDDIENQCSYTMQFAQWAIQNKVKDFIYMSSDKAKCGETEADLIDDAGRIKTKTKYGAAKRYTEIQLSKLFEGSSTRLIILRNPIVYGPGCNSNIRNLLQIADSAWVRPTMLRDTRKTTVSITNCCDAIKTALDTPDAPGGIYLIADDGQISTNEIIDLFRKELGRKISLISFPKWFWKLTKSMQGKKAKIRRQTGIHASRDNRFQKHFGWLPSQTTRQSLQDMVRMYVREGK